MLFLIGLWLSVFMCARANACSCIEYAVTSVLRSGSNVELHVQPWRYWRVTAVELRDVRGRSIPITATWVERSGQGRWVVTPSKPLLPGVYQVSLLRATGSTWRQEVRIGGRAHEPAPVLLRSRVVPVTDGECTREGTAVEVVTSSPTESFTGAFAVWVVASGEAPVDGASADWFERPRPVGMDELGFYLGQSYCDNDPGYGLLPDTEYVVRPIDATGRLGDAVRIHP